MSDVELGRPDGRERWVVEHEGRRVLVLRHGEGWTAVDADCPHRDADLAGGVVRGDRLVCPGHWYAFDLGDGSCHTSPGYRLGVYSVRETPTGLIADVPRRVQRSWSEVLRDHARATSAGGPQSSTARTTVSASTANRPGGTHA